MRATVRGVDQVADVAGGVVEFELIRAPARLMAATKSPSARATFSKPAARVSSVSQSSPLKKDLLTGSCMRMRIWSNVCTVMDSTRKNAREIIAFYGGQSQLDGRTALKRHVVWVCFGLISSTEAASPNFFLPLFTFIHLYQALAAFTVLDRAPLRFF